MYRPLILGEGLDADRLRKYYYCTCSCSDRSEILTGKRKRSAYVRIDIVCSCCDRHKCPVHYPKNYEKTISG